MEFSWLLYSTQKNFLSVLMNSQPDFRKKNPLESEKKLDHHFLTMISVISSIWTMEEDLTPRGVLLKSVSRSFDFSRILVPV